MRRLFHLISGLFLIFITAYLDSMKGILLVLSLFILMSIVEVIRLYHPDVNRLFLRCFSLLVRPHEENKPTTTIYFLSGMLISLIFFNRDIALYAITILTIGDPAASTFGKRFGRHLFKGKSLEGSLAFLFVSFITGLILHRLWPGLSTEIMIAGAVAGTIAELLSIRIDDNLIIPVASSVVMQGLSSLI